MTRPARRARVDHQATAQRLRTRPGRWEPIGTYANKDGAGKIARDIRAAYQRHGDRGPSPYQPAGAYQAYARMAEDSWQVIARYVGDRARKEPAS